MSSTKEKDVTLKESPKIAQSTRTGIRLIGTEETNMPAIDYTYVGSDSNHKKDGTTIIDATSVDVDSVFGEIKNSFKIGTEAYNDNTDWDQLHVIKNPTITLSTKYLKTLNIFGISDVHEYDIDSPLTVVGNEDTDESPIPTVLVGSSIEVDIVVSNDSYFPYLPVIPTVGTINMVNLDVSIGDVKRSKQSAHYDFSIPVVFSGACDNVTADTFIKVKHKSSENYAVDAYKGAQLTSEFVGEYSECGFDRIDETTTQELSDAILSDGYTYGGVGYHNVPYYTLRKNKIYRLRFIINSITQFVSENVPNGEYNTCNGQQVFSVILDSVTTLSTSFEPETPLTTNTTYTFWIKYKKRFEMSGWTESDSQYIAYRVIGVFGEYSLCAIRKYYWYSGDNSVVYITFGVMYDGVLYHPMNAGSVCSHDMENGKIDISWSKCLSDQTRNGSVEFLVGFKCHNYSTVSDEIIVSVSANTLGNICPIMYGDISYLKDKIVVEVATIEDKSSSVSTYYSTDAINPPEINMVAMPDKVGDVYEIRFEHSSKFNRHLNVISRYANMYVGGEAYLYTLYRRKIEMSFGRSIPLCIPNLITNAHAEIVGISSEYLSGTVIPLILPIVTNVRNTDRSYTVAFVIPRGGNNDGDLAQEYLDNGCDLTDPLYLPLTIPQRKTFYQRVRDLIRGNSCSNVYSFADDAPDTTPLIDATDKCFIGSLVLYETQDINSAGSPSAVQFSIAVNDAEFINRPAINSIKRILYRGKDLLSTKYGVFNPSQLYYMTGTSYADLKDIPRQLSVYEAISQYMITSGNNITTIYASDDFSTVCVGSVDGTVIESPHMTSNGMMFGVQYGNTVSIYTVREYKLLRLKTVDAVTSISRPGFARIVRLDTLGLCLVIYTQGVTQALSYIMIYSLAGSNIVNIGVVSKVTDVAIVDNNGQAMLTCLYDDTRSKIVKSSAIASGSIDSSKFIFPKFDGMTMLVAGIIVTVKSTTSFKVVIEVNNIKALSNLTVSTSCQAVVRLSTAIPVGFAKYTLTGITGTIIDVKWIVYPVPLVAESI